MTRVLSRVQSTKLDLFHFIGGYYDEGNSGTKKTGEVLQAIQKLGVNDPDIDAYFNRLVFEEFETRVGPEFDPDIHYDLSLLKE